MKSNIKHLLLMGSLFALITWMIFVYPWLRLYSWSENTGPLSWTSITILWILPMLLFILWVKARNNTTAFLGLLSLNWLGVSTMFMLAAAVLEVPALIFPASRPWLAPALVISGGGLCLYAIYNASRFKLKTISINSGNLSRPVKAVHLSDIHLGSRSVTFLTRIIARTNLLDPDVVFITGDLIDMSSTTPGELAVLARLKAPVYFIAGNHEHYAANDQHFAALEKAGITVLDQQAVIHGDLQIIGVADSGDKNHLARTLPALNIEQDLFTVLLYHRPNNWQYVSQSGIDLMLSGHTHSGQIFPFDLITRKYFPNLHGQYTDNGANLYVSMGTGTWGPAMRLGSVNEITLIDMQPGDFR